MDDNAPAALDRGGVLPRKPATRSQRPKLFAQAAAFSFADQIKGVLADEAFAGGVMKKARIAIRADDPAGRIGGNQQVRGRKSQFAEPVTIIG
ncbi:MAG TPA: hypothetical protein VG942_10120 [Hyphomonadaceae bacterium]|nr:hypothetical protein [Hyphomonadaceae bacterium]